jgi:hypothetical protein
MSLVPKEKRQQISLPAFSIGDWVFSYEVLLVLVREHLLAE